MMQAPQSPGEDGSPGPGTCAAGAGVLSGTWPAVFTSQGLSVCWLRIRHGTGGT